MNDHSQDSLGEIEYLDPVDIQNASIDELRSTVLYLNHKYSQIYQELQARTAELAELHRLGSADSNFEIVNHGFEVNSEINRIRTEYTEKMKDLVARHELEIEQIHIKYEHSMKEIEAEIRGQSRQHMIDEIDEKCTKFIEDMRVKEEQLERTRQELELGRQQDRSDLLFAQEEIQRFKDEVSALKNDQVLKAAQISTLQSQIESERARLEQERNRLRDQQQRTINERIAYEQERFRKDQEQLKKEQERYRQEEQKNRGKLSTTTEEMSRLKNLLEDQRVKSVELEHYNIQMRQKVASLSEQLERQKSINDNFRQFAEKKESESRRLAQDLKKTGEENARLKQTKNNHSEGLEKEVERLNTRLRGLTEEFQQERHNIEQRCANQLKGKLDQAGKIKDLELDQLRLDLEVKGREISRLQGKVSEVEMLNKCNVNLINQKNSLCEKQLEEINKKSKQIRTLQNEVAELREKDHLLEKLEQDLRDKDKTIIALEQQIREGLKRFERAAEESKAKDKKIAAMELQAEEHCKTIERLNTEVSVKEKVAGRFEQSNKEIDKNVASLSEELRGKTMIIAKLEHQIADLNRNSSDLAQQNNTRIKQVAALQLQIKDTNNKLLDKNRSLQELVNLNNQLENKEREIREAHDKVKRELDRLLLKLKEQEISLRQSEERLQVQEADLTSTSRSYGEQLQKLTTELQNYESRIKECEAREGLLKEQLSRTKEKMKTLQRDKATADKVQEYKDLLQSTTSLNESINEQLKKSHKRVIELEQQLNEQRDRGRSRTEPVEGMLREAERTIISLQADIAQSKLHLGNLTNEKRFLEIKLEELKKDRDSLAAASKAKLERAQEQLRQRQLHFSSDKQALNEQLMRVRQSLESLSNRQTETRLENQMLKGELEALTKNLAASIDEQKMKVADNQALRRKIRALEEQSSKQRITLQREESFNDKPSFGDKLMEGDTIRQKQQSEDRGYELSRLKQQLEERAAESIRLKHQLDKSIEEKGLEQTRLRQELKAASQRSEEVISELSTTKRELDNMRLQLQQSRSELTNSKQIEARKESASQLELDRLKVTINNLTKELADGKRQLNSQSGKIEQLKRQKKDLEKLLNEAEQTLIEESSRAKRGNYNLQIQHQEDMTRENLERLQAYCESLKVKSKEEIDRLASEVQHLHSKGLEDRRVFEQKIAKLREDCDEQLNEASVRHEAELKKHREERAKLKEEVNKVIAERAKQTEMYEDLKGKNGRLARELEIKEDKLAGLQALIDQTGNQLSSESSAQAILKEQIRKLEGQVADKYRLQNKIAQLEGRCRQLNEARAESESKLLDQEAQLTDATNTVVRLKKDLAVLQKTYTSTVEQLNTNEQLVAEMRIRLQNKEQSKNNELQSVFNQVERLNSLLVEKEREVGDLKSQKSVKLERKRSQEKIVQFANMPVTSQSAHFQSPPQYQQFIRPAQLPSNRNVARTADECWDDIQGRIQAVREENERLKNVVGGNLH